MKTTRLDSKPPAAFDVALLMSMKLRQVTPQAMWRESILIGIRNEYGDIYRVIGVTDIEDFLHALTKLHRLGYRIVDVSGYEAALGFDAVVASPNHA